ncbi:unnamed protein product [Caretta caretta]
MGGGGCDHRGWELGLKRDPEPWFSGAAFWRTPWGTWACFVCAGMTLMSSAWKKEAKPPGANAQARHPQALLSPAMLSVPEAEQAACVSHSTTSLLPGVQRESVMCTRRVTQPSPLASQHRKGKQHTQTAPFLTAEVF